MADNKKPTGKKKSDPRPITEPLEGKPVEQSPAPENAPGKELEADVKQAWSRFKDGKAQFDVDVLNKGKHSWGEHFVNEEPETFEETANYILEELDGYKQLNEILQQEAASITEQANKLLKIDVTPETLSEWRKYITEFVERISATWQDYFESIRQTIAQHIALKPEVIESMQTMLDSISHNDYIQAALEEYKRLEPYIQAELAKRGISDLQELTKSEIREIDAAARAAMAEADTTSVTSHRPDSLAFPLTKISRDLFTMLNIESAQKGAIPGQLTFAENTLAVEGRKDKRERSILYSIQFNDIYDTAKISKALTQFDRRVYDAVSSLYAAGNSYMTLAQIHLMMGNTSRPNDTQRQKIIDSLDKMASAWITLDQSEDYAEYVNAAKGKLGLKYNGQLIYMETLEARFNGKLAEKAIHIIKEPVLHKMAIDRGQITAIPRAVLETGKSQNEDYLNLENYILDRISQMKNRKRNSTNKIKYASLYDALEITGNTDSIKKKRTRTKKKLYELLDHYKEKKWIKGYKEDSTGEPGVEIEC